MNNTLPAITISNGLKAYNNADEKGKELLKNLWGESVFNQKITDRVKTVEDAYAILGIEKSIILSNSASELYYAASDHLDLMVVCKALNEGWIPDWSDSSQRKFYPWFEHKSGSGLSYDDCDYSFSVTVVGARLCFKSSELAIYAGQQFQELYRSYFTMNHPY